MHEWLFFVGIVFTIIREVRTYNYTTSLCQNDRRRQSELWPRLISQSSGQFDADATNSEKKNYIDDCNKILHIKMNEEFNQEMMTVIVDRNEEKVSQELPMTIILSLSHPNPRNVTIDAINAKLDDFLMIRPWWFIEYESATNDEYVVIFRRYPLEWLLFHRYIIATQHLQSLSDCEIAPALIGQKSKFRLGLIHILTTFTQAKLGLHESVFNVFVPSHNRSEWTDDLCAGEVNKWTCAFLSYSSCPIPKSIIDGHGEGDTVIVSFDRSTSDAIGINIKNISEAIEKSRESSQKKKSLSYLNEFSGLPAIPEFRHESTSSLHLPRKRKSAVETVLLHTYILRPSWVHRKAINDLITSFQQSNPTYSSSSCIAMYLRKSSRMTSSNIMEVLNRIPSLTNTSLRDIVVISDMESSKLALKNASSRWNFHVFEAYRHGICSHSSPKSDCGVFLLAAVKLIQKCSVFIGHSSTSSLGEFFFESMCVRHDDRFGTCPVLHELAILHRHNLSSSSSHNAYLQ